MLPVAISMLGTGARRPTVAFLGWFGPRGAASIVFALLVLEGRGLPHENIVLTTSFVTVGLSVLLHGVTAAPLAKRYADWHDARAAETPVESGQEEEELPWRLQAE
jgi:NhaP-type Na+/H+ or K+/H+ antiporter